MIKSKATVTVNLAAVDAFTDAEIARGVEGATLEGLRIVQDTLSQPGSGVIYKRGSVTHQASAPGEPPAPDRGKLRESAEREAAGPHGVVSVNADYALPLELGTEKMAPRPFISKLADNTGRLLAAFVAYAR